MLHPLVCEPILTNQCSEEPMRGKEINTYGCHLVRMPHELLYDIMPEEDPQNVHMDYQFQLGAILLDASLQA